MTTMSTIAAAEEPNVELARKWWPELTNVVTPVGWRDHFHRFNIAYEGTVIARPPTKPPQEGEYSTPQAGVQLAFWPVPDATSPVPTTQELLAINGGRKVGDQGWAEGPTPTLWTRWLPQEPGSPLAGLELRSFAFAHKSGGGESVTGLEPMYCWIRLQVTARAPTTKAQTCGFWIKINSPHIKFAMIEADNFRVQSEQSGYPRKLRGAKDPSGAFFIVEEDDTIRMAVLPGATDVQLHPRAEGSNDQFLFAAMPATVGAHVDLLVPMLRQPREELAREMSLGRDGALAEANAFWQPKPPTAATIHTPEPLINAAIEHNIKLARMISLTIPQTRQKTLLSGSMVYSMLWITPTSMTSHMVLDPLGWHEDVDKYLEIHRQEQGKVKAPGPNYPPHPGYFGVPEPIDSGHQWLTDHGAVMFTASRHALLSDDRKFTEKWTPALIKSYEFIRDSRRLPRTAPQVDGVMPSAAASDKSDPIQSFWSDAWLYKGLSETVRLFRHINHPRAEEFGQEAAAYREAIVKAFRAKAARMPRWKDASGRDRTTVPMSLTADDSNGYGIEHPFYLDTGPMFGVWAGVLPADDPLMRDSADFFREGPHIRASSDATFRWEGAARLVYEMSNAEPCYSWNVYHSYEHGERERYLQCLYSIFLGALSTQTHISCETRGGITENVFSVTLGVDLVRRAVIDDELEPATLHLLRLVPLAWCSQSEQTRFENMPTEFGPVTLKWQLIDGGKTLELSYLPRFRREPQAVVLHVPPLAGIDAVTINGHKHRGIRSGDRIKL
jgi:hypothetical protein